VPSETYPGFLESRSVSERRPYFQLEVNQSGEVQLIDCGDFLFAVAITEAAKSGDNRR
jgi:hypothetical protein